MTKKHKPSPPIAVAVRQAHGWIAASIAQGDRLLRLIKEQEAAGPPQTWSAEQRAAFNRVHGLAWDHLTEDFEAYYFLCALRQADRWLQHAAKVDPELTAAVAGFESAAPHLKDIRDMREHEDEYLAGAGNAADRYRSSYNGLETTVHGIVVHGNDYLIGGGRVHVAHTLEALRTLLRVVEGVRARVAPPSPIEFSLSVGAAPTEGKADM
jgi:hypothetical protein